MVSLLGVGYAFWLKQLQAAAPQISQLDNVRLRLSTDPTVLVSADGQTLFTLMAENREWVTISQVPQRVKDATIAAEDRRFYQHEGIDPIAVVRQLFTNVRERRVAGGASTLTMQLAKRLYTGSEKTFSRKLQDMAIAVQIERQYTKDYILEMYLNQVFYGSWSYGIQRAAQTYFGKTLDQLTIAEAALLARCVRRPSEENPYANLAKAVENRNVVLRVMLDEGMISSAEYHEALQEKVRLRPKPRFGASGPKAAPYFVDYILDVVRDQLPHIDLSQGGYRIETTIDMRMQKIAEDEVRDLVRRYRRSRVTTGAFLMTDRDGRILAMVGGVEYDRNQYNVITQGHRQPGSAFKPFVYACALETGDIAPNSRLSNERFVWKDPATGQAWRPKNSSGRYGGTTSVASAIAWSINMPAIRVMERIGPRTFVPMAKRIFGFRSDLDPVLALALGATAVSPMEMARGYSVFMLRGDRASPFGLRRVTDPTGRVIYDAAPSIRTGVLSAETAEDMDSFLRGVVTGGTARRAGAVANARGKTGTTSDNRDAWFVGYTDQLLGVGWIANELPNKGSGSKWRYEPMSSQVFGGTVTVQMWSAILGKAQKLVGETRDTGSWERRKIEPEEPSVEDVPPEDIQIEEQVGLAEQDEARQQDAPTEKANPTPELDPAEERADIPPESSATAPEPAMRRASSDGATVTVMICADTGLLAREGCPEQVPTTFRRGREPKKYCARHGR